MAGGTGGGGVATGAGTRVDVTLKLSQLQNLCKRDPQGYREDYDAQTRRLESECGILALSPSSEPSSRLTELIQFAAAVSSSSYKGVESNRIAHMLMNLLVGNPTNTSTNNNTNTANKEQQQQSVANVVHLSTMALQLHRDVRKACVSALILMRNKGAVEPIQLLELFFRVMAVVPDKALREQLHRHIVNDIRNINNHKGGKRRDDHLNRSIQAFFHRIVSTHGHEANNGTSGVEESATAVAAKRATEMVCELYRRKVWTDDRTVAILATACQSLNTTVMARSMKFFLNIEETMAEDDRRLEEDEWAGKSQIDYHQHSRKTHARQRHVQRQLKNRKKQQRKRDGINGLGGDLSDQAAHIIHNDEGVEHARKLYPAIELIHDPQGLAEAVLKRVRSAGGKAYKYDLKLLMINFVTRLVGNHELMVLPLYPFLQKYMGGHQRDVTAILAYAVQACHEHVPPEELYGILQTIAHNFITERCSEEQMAVGINAARAICARVPTLLSIQDNTTEDDNGKTSSSRLVKAGSTVMDIEAFARDLAGYVNYRDRSVSIAAKAWTNFVRETHPGLLQGKHRGLKGSALHKAGARPKRYGEQTVNVGVEGADLLVEYESKKAAHLQRLKQNEQKEGVDYENDGEEEDDDGFVEMEDDELDGDESAPDLIVLEDSTGKAAEKDGDEEADARKDDDDAEDDDGNDDEPVIDLSKMTKEERDKLRMEVSSTRVFTSRDFELMRKLVDREQRAKRDPREAARRKRALARGDGFEELSGDDGSDGDSDEEDQVHVAGAVNPSDIMATAARKRQNKAERLEKVLAGREKFQSRAREGGSTNVEKKRKKNFQMSKFSFDARTKGRGKTMLKDKATRKSGNLTHENKKRRRKI